MLAYFVSVWCVMKQLQAWCVPLPFCRGVQELLVVLTACQQVMTALQMLPMRARQLQLQQTVRQQLVLLTVRLYSQTLHSQMQPRQGQHQQQ